MNIDAFGTAYANTALVNTLGTDLVNVSELSINVPVVNFYQSSEFNVASLNVKQNTISLNSSNIVKTIDFGHDGTVASLVHGSTGFSFTDHGLSSMKAKSLVIAGTDFLNNPSADEFTITSRFGRMEIQHSIDGTLAMFAPFTANLTAPGVTGSKLVLPHSTTFNNAQFTQIQLGTTDMWRIVPSGMQKQINGQWINI